ncbi:MAG: ABC transporter permease [Anaerolineaceae bacterium]|nr:ABC transporter permease [Anaerolineaceae bacterium]MBN2678304.1 ABC transporter permease [Anaerolineaceae bacterium]
MMKKRWLNLGFQLSALVLALGFTTLILLATKTDPWQAYKYIIIGSISSLRKFTDVLVSFVPLLLVSSGLLVTFSAGLWNIGVEGQITLGAIATTWVLRLLQDSSLAPGLIIALAMLAGMLGGALWASLAGALKTYGGVNEIFGGLGLNFVATALTLWLIFGPWKRPGIGSMSGTEPFPNTLWLPMISGFRLSLWGLGLGVFFIILIYFLMKGTYFGLRIKAVGKNLKAAYLLGVPTTRYLMLAFILGGALAGLTGAIQVTAVYHRLIPSISSGYGFLGLLVAMLVNFQAIWVAPIALFFAALNIGSIQLPIVLKLDSTLSGVLQGVLVLFVLLMDGVRQMITRRSGGAS